MLSVLLLVTTFFQTFNAISYPSPSLPKTTSVIHASAPPVVSPPAIVASPSATIKPTPTKKPRPTKKPTPRPLRKTTTRPKPTVKPVSQQTPYPLVNEVNLYRQENGKGAITSDNMLCDIASKRIEELVNNGSLDNHAGFQKYTDQIKQAFHQWWEVIHWSSPAWSARDVVYKGWANSSGHKDALLSSATHGCGALKNGFGVFVLGEK